MLDVGSFRRALRAWRRSLHGTPLQTPLNGKIFGRGETGLPAARGDRDWVVSHRSPGLPSRGLERLRNLGANVIWRPMAKIWSSPMIRPPECVGPIDAAGHLAAAEPGIMLTELGESGGATLLHQLTRQRLHDLAHADALIVPGREKGGVEGHLRMSPPASSKRRPRNSKSISGRAAPSPGASSATAAPAPPVPGAETR